MSEAYEDRLSLAMAELKSARRILNREIGEYPGPVSGCDAQFNRLLSDRRRIADAMRALRSEPFVATPRIPDPGAPVESR